MGILVKEIEARNIGFVNVSMMCFKSQTIGISPSPF